MVQVFKSEYNLRAIETCVRLSESAHSPQVRKHFSTWHKLEDHKQIEVVLCQNFFSQTFLQLKRRKVDYFEVIS